MNFISNEAYLPEPGKYYLFYGFGEDPKVLDINNYGIIIDTLYTIRIRFAVPISNPPSSYYFDCNGLANGRVIDYYYSGGGYPGGDFPDNITLIDADDFQEILIYRDGKEFQMIKFEYQKDGNVYVNKLILSEKNNDVWVEKETMNATEVYKLLENHLSNYAL